jgi:alpha-glucosidase (family GH31 glycosyl hydrolase)
VRLASLIDILTKTSNPKPPNRYSETGVIDLYLMADKSPSKVQQMYTRLSGRQFMPPMFSLGYHQCRWNYRDDADVRDVDANFDKHEIPYDVIWLDIEHTDGKRYLTWDKALFPDPTKLQRDIGAKGRKMVMTLNLEP